jgi:biopolymer transport protein ExbD
VRSRCSTTSISALLLSLCLVISIPAALSNVATWNEFSIKLPYGSIWNFLAPLGFAYLGIVAIGLIVLWTGYRKRERWAWFVMLIALLFFYFPSSVLPVLLQIHHFGWPVLLDLFGACRGGEWLHCWIVSLRPNYSVGMACASVLILSGLLKFLVMLVALLLPIKAFFWEPIPPQPGMRTKIAALFKKQTWVWVLTLLLVFVLAVAFIMRSRIASTQNSVAQNQQSNAWRDLPPAIVAVELAKAENAVAMPEAGSEDAIVVVVTRNGMVFLGQNRIDPPQLGSYIRDKLASKTDKTIYFRADARAKYRDVENAIDNLRSTGVKEVGLLTKRKENTQPEDYLWVGNPLLKSVGLEVIIPPLPEIPTRGSSLQDRTIIVHVIYRPNATPAYKIDAADIAHDELQSKLTEIYANRAERVMFVKGDNNLRFSDIADVIDIGRASNADHIGLITPGLTAGN